MKLPINFFVRTALAILFITGSLAACTYGTYDDAVANYNAGLPPPPPPPPPPGFGPNFSEIQASVFTPMCESCHSGGGASAGLSLDAANSYTMLVGIASSQDAGTQRVNPGNPNISYLIQKLEGPGVSGQQMPPGAPLPQADIDVIRTWITQGATDDRVVPVTPIRVASLAPIPSATPLIAPPSQIVAGFDREPVAASVDATTFILEASGGDGTFAEGNEVQIAAAQISVPAANPMSAIFDIPAASPLTDETYRVRLLGTGASIIQDMDGNALDGEFAGAFPSGDGTVGGDFEAEFTVTSPTMDQIQATVFTPVCSGCHSGGNPAGGLDLSDADTSHAQLVGIMSSAQAGAIRIIPFDANNSYLIQKLDGAIGIAGGRMPPGAALPQPTIDMIRQWITNGAVR